MRLNINGKSDSNQNFDLNSNFPSWPFVRNKVHEEGMISSLGGTAGKGPFTNEVSREGEGGGLPNY